MEHWKADEMEMSINFRAMRLAWLFSELALAAYCMAAALANGDLPSIPLIVLCISGVIFWLSKLIMAKQMSAGGSYGEE